MTITDIPKPDGPDDNIGWRVLYISWALYGIAFIVVCLRVFAQAKVTRRLQWGDALMIFALKNEACNSATDLILTFLPAYMFWGLHMQLSTKVGLVALMGLSIFAFVASVIKTILLQSLGYRSDFTRNVAALFIWLHVENTLVITAASIPMTRPLFQNSNETKSSTYEMDEYRNNRVNSNTFRRIMVNAIDTTSEENIMPREEQGITIQTDIVVEYEEEETGKVPSDQTGPNIWV
ncbi:hypothetical protein FocTR4_00014697 [Fusarium oxysporum f. sp. cubense]|uniref:Rhodopsin domain-containing protein n=1 Tax=Fusarium oxysporum f. sp. cubense TaxID=61366 RepID=A0A5C6SNN6_FUSOC|nr:hypothetical protein FocTR4_00014697 [Fusarium oxysporum f. sp. cubense]